MPPGTYRRRCCPLLTTRRSPRCLYTFLNAGVIGFNWALIRRKSGSIVVSSVSHGVWNSLVYTLFGYGTTLGILGIHNTAVVGPEVGFVGLALNLALAAVLWLGDSGSRAMQTAEA